jgi:CRISPR system Cascade subunit CasD
MADHLVFTLAAAMAAMGDLAGHERRGTMSWPARSAILGLLAAAQGVRREDAAGLAALAPLRMAVAVHDDGTPLRDYHTVQTAPSAAVRRPDSRPEALARAGQAVNTTITLRDYRVGVLYSVAVWGLPLAPLAVALRRPVFTLYLGRKSCPLSAPPAPHIIEADSPLQALRQAQLPEFRNNRQGPLPIQLIASDEDLGGGHSEWRNDVPLDRGRWHFTSRQVHFLRPAAVEGGA